MDKESERESSIETLLNQERIYSYCQKVEYDFMKRLFVDLVEQLNPVLKESALEDFGELSQMFQLSGSVVEGCAFARNLNPNLPGKYIEGEFDIMLPFAKILKNKYREIIVDLTYARGFAWIKYESECFGLDSRPELGQLLVKHEDGNTYLNAKAVRHAHNTGLESSPDFHGIIKEQIEGPSSNIESTANHLRITSKASVNGAIKTLHDCVLFINDASEDLKKIHSDVLSKLKELELVTQGNCELISITDVEELASLILPSNKGRKNVLLQIHWMLLVFMNKALSTTLTIDRMLKKSDVLENLGFLRNLYFSLYSNPKTLFDCLDANFKYLRDILPTEVLQKYKKKPADGLSYFYQKCFFCYLNKGGELFRFLDDYKKELSVKCKFLEIFSGLREDQLEKLGSIEEICLSIDRVPAMFVHDWPNIAGEWVIRERLWPTLSLVKEIIAKGCYIVPKPYYGHKGNDILDWRWSFSLAEMIIANARTKEMDLSYLVLKSIFYRYLKPVEYDDKTLTSYLIKTVLLWQCEENDETWWSERRIVSCISVLLNRLKESFYNKHLPHYFIRDINLFDNVDDELVLYGQAILESICADPIICIAEVFEKTVVEKSEKSDKNSPKTDFEFKLNMPQIIAEAQECIKDKKEEFKDANAPALFGTSINLLQTMFEKVMPQLFPGVPEDQGENISHNSDINLDEIAEIVKHEFSDTFNIPLD